MQNLRTPRIWYSGFENSAPKKKHRRTKRKKIKAQKLAKRTGFYATDEWLTVRYEVLRRSKGCCMLCGQRPYNGNPLHVDHIKPKSKYPELALTISNLQVLCRACNLGKSNLYEDDWREIEQPEDADWYRNHERQLSGQTP